jgi:hypothetical protein
MLDTDVLRAEIEAEFTRQLAPELAATGANQVYVLWNSECRHPGRWRGLYHCWFAGWYRQVIGNRWNGPGPCWILNDRLIQKQVKSGCRDDREKEFREVSWGVSIHEASHAVLIPTFMLPPEDATPRFDGIMRQSADETRKGAKRGAVESWKDAMTDGAHGVDFDRIATHLAWRVAEGRGNSVSTLWEPTAVLGLMQATFAIRSELNSLRGVPISQIAKMAVPEALLHEHQRKFREFGLDSWVLKQAASC